MPFIPLKELDSSEGTVQLHAQVEDGHLILHPTPNSKDPNDPLRWGRPKKAVAFGSVCAFVFLSNYALGGLSPAFYILSHDFHISQAGVTALLSWPVLVLGAFNFFWVPVSNYLGKRPVFVFAQLLLCLCTLWGALAQSFESLLWSRIVAAFAGSSTESLGSATVNDVYLLHERGKYMGIYMLALSGGNTIGPLICGFVVTGLSWRWHNWIAFILCAVNWIIVVLFVPETRYERSEVLSHGLLHSQQPRRRPLTDDTVATADVEKSNESRLEGGSDISDPASPQVPKKTWLQELNPWSGICSSGSIFKLFLRPLPLLAFPAVMFSFIGYAVSLAWVLSINVLNPFVLQAPPYSWKPDVNGLINIAGFIGNLAGSFFGGWLMDRYSDWRSKRNSGVFQPETRLHLLIIPALIVPAGCLAFGYGVARSLNWTSLFFGYGMVAVGLTWQPVSTMTYVSDLYYDVYADCFQLINGLKNIVAFGFLYGVVPWVQENGYVGTFGAQAGFYVFVMSLALPLVIYGKRARHTTAQRPIILQQRTRSQARSS